MIRRAKAAYLPEAAAVMTQMLMLYVCGNGNILSIFNHDHRMRNILRQIWTLTCSSSCYCSWLRRAAGGGKFKWISPPRARLFNFFQLNFLAAQSFISGRWCMRMGVIKLTYVENRCLWWIRSQPPTNKLSAASYILRDWFDLNGDQEISGK